MHVLKCSTLTTDKEIPRPDQDLKRLWKLEGMGISPTEGSVYDGFTDTISFKEGRCEVNVAWKQQRPLLPDNHEPRFNTLFKRLKKDREVLQEYDAVIKDQIE